MKYLFVLLLLCTDLYGQIITVADSLTEAPVADVLFRAGDKAVYSNSAGQADLSIFGREDSVRVTHISYRSIIIIPSDIRSGSRILLTPSAIKKDEVIVTGENYPVTADILNVDPVKSASLPALSDIIKNYTGLYIKDYGGVSGIKLLSFRGMGSENTQVLFNEFRVNDLKTGTFDLSGLASDAVDKIVIQSDNLTDISAGGVLRLYSGNLTAKNNLYLSAGTDINGLQKWGGGVNYHKGSVSGGASIERAVTSNEFSYNFEGRDHKRQNAFLNKTFFSGNVNWLGESTTVKLYSHYNSLYTGVPGFVVTNNAASNGSTNKNISWLTTLRADHNLTGSLRLETGVSYHNQSLNYYDPVREYFKPKSSESSHLDDLTGILRLNKRLSSLELTAGYEINYAAIDGLKNFITSSGNTDQLSRTSNKISLGAAFTPPAGIPAIINPVLSGLFTKEFISEQFNDNLYSEPFSYLLRFNTGFSFDSGLFVSASYFDTYRNPTFNERYYSIIFDPGLLRREKFRGIEISANYRRELILFNEISVTWYDIESSDKIIWVPTGVALQIPRNLVKVVTSGAEISARGSLSHFSWGANYSYTPARNRSASNPGDMTYDKQMIYTPLHRFNLSLSADISPLTFNLWLNYSSESWFTGDNDPFNKLDSWYTIDASVVMAINSGGLNHILSVSVYNMLNRNYMIVQSYPMPLFTAAFTYKLLLEY